MEYLAKIDDMGGASQAIEFMQEEIHQAAYRFQMDIESGERSVVGVNVHSEDEGPPRIGQPDYSAPGAKVVADLDQALELAGHLVVVEGHDEVVVIGGAQIYRLALPRADRLYLTQVHADVEGDTRFPDFDAAEWREVAREDYAAEGPNPYDYSFIVYDRA